MQPAPQPRVTAAVVTHERPDQVLGALKSLLATTSAEVLVIENGSDARARAALAGAVADQPRIRVHQSERNLGCSGGVQLAAELIDSELVLVIDDDAELLPGALEHLIAELDGHPEAGAVGATIILPDGRISCSGGFYSETPETVEFELGSCGLPFQTTVMPPSGPCDWLIGAGFLARRQLLLEFPHDPRMLTYSDDLEWGLRVSRARPGCFRRSREALVLHHAHEKPWGSTSREDRARLVGPIAAAAHIYNLYGLVPCVPGCDLFACMPELLRPDGSRDIPAARLILELAGSHSTDWMLEQWMNGGLDPLLGGRPSAPAEELAEELAACRSALEAERARHAHTSARLEHAYGTRLWQLGGLLDRTRTRARSLLRHR